MAGNEEETKRQIIFSFSIPLEHCTYAYVAPVAIFHQYLVHVVMTEVIFPPTAGRV